LPRFWLLKARLEGDTPARGALPVPLKATVCGLPLALSATLNWAVRLPAAEGEKVTVMLQVMKAATVVPQVLV